MSKWPVFLSIVLSLTTACVESKTNVVLGTKKYIIPSEYVVSYDGGDSSGELDVSANIVALTFTDDEELGHLIGSNGWLPRSPITAVIYYNGAGTFEGLLSKEIFAEQMDVVNFEDSYRIFTSNVNSRWTAVPKSGTTIGSSTILAERKLDCTAMGGTKGIKASRTDKNIPTACKVTIKSGPLIIRLSSTEKNLIEHFDFIYSLIAKKLDAWENKD